MESHWPHRTAKRSIFSLAVSNGGSIYLLYLYVYIFTGIFLYFFVSWLFQMGSHWPHWTVQRSLCALAVLNRGVHLPLVSLCLYMYWYFLTFSYKLTVSNGFSLMVWKHIAVTFSSSSFKWGEDITCHFLVNWLFRMGSHWWYGNA